MSKVVLRHAGNEASMEAHSLASVALRVTSVLDWLSLKAAPGCRPGPKVTQQLSAFKELSHGVCGQVLTNVEKPNVSSFYDSTQWFATACVLVRCEFSHKWQINLGNKTETE